MSRRRILVVDDEVNMQRILELMLQDMGHEVLRASNGGEALVVLEQEPIDLLITDLRMPVMDGIALLQALHERALQLPAIVITAHGTVASAVTAMQCGAVDYILRPFEVETVELAVTRALGLGQVQRENRFLRNEVERGWEGFIGRSASMQALYRVVEQTAPSGASVLIVGETGTGKELVAHALHRASGRNGLFVPLNCAAIAESILESELFGHVKGAFTGASRERVGKFEFADGGTLFLDEITEMPVELQSKLLRVLQEARIERLGSNRQIDIDLRVIAASNRDPLQAVADGRLREDLFYRLNVVRIDVPPLRERGEDIVLLAEHFLERHARRLNREAPQLDAAALAALRRYAWPGNVRELENLMERSVVLGDIGDLGRQLQPAAIAEAKSGIPTLAPGPESLALQPHVEALERQLIAAALEASGGAKARAARLLDISERSLWYKVKKYGLA